MPYRRLPNTDEARIRALQRVLEKENDLGIRDRIVTLDVMAEMHTLLNKFKEAQTNYKYALKTQSNANIKYQVMVKNAKLYISHFIQVLNLAIIRSEIKESNKSLYGLNPTDYSIPDMLSEHAVMKWGEKIIQGENNRMQQGGAPIYNPTIAKVKVHYDLFKEAFYTQKTYQKNTIRTLEALAEQRPLIDKLITNVWNQIEEHFKDVKGEDRLDKCRNYGVVYYYRKGETKDS